MVSKLVCPVMLCRSNLHPQKKSRPMMLSPPAPRTRRVSGPADTQTHADGSAQHRRGRT